MELEGKKIYWHIVIFMTLKEITLILFTLAIVYKTYLIILKLTSAFTLYCPQKSLEYNILGARVLMIFYHALKR